MEIQQFSKVLKKLVEFSTQSRGRVRIGKLSTKTNIGKKYSNCLKSLLRLSFKTLSSGHLATAHGPV